MKEIVVPCRINGAVGTRKLYVGDGCRDDKGPVDAQVAWCAARNITFSDDALKNIAALRDLAREQMVSFEELVVLAYMIANKRMARRATGGNMDDVTPDDVDLSTVTSTAGDRAASGDDAKNADDAKNG